MRICLVVGGGLLVRCCAGRDVVWRRPAGSARHSHLQEASTLKSRINNPSGFNLVGRGVSQFLGAHSGLPVEALRWRKGAHSFEVKVFSISGGFQRLLWRAERWSRGPPLDYAQHKKKQSGLLNQQ